MERIYIRAKHIAPNLQFEVWVNTLPSEPATFTLSAAYNEFPSTQAINIARRTADLQPVGVAIFNALFRDESLRRLYRTTRKRATESREGLALLLGLDQDASTIPWELMRDPETAYYIATDRHQTIIRVFGTQNAVTLNRSRRNDLPVRILHVIASPIDEPIIDPTPLLLELTEMQEDGRILVETVEGNDTLERMRGKRKNPEDGFNIVHIESHGSSDVKGWGYLSLCDKDGYSTRSDGQELSASINFIGGADLVILNACMTGDIISSYPFGSLSRTLIGNNVPVVVGMNGIVRGQDAAAFIQVFLDLLIRSNHEIYKSMALARMRMVEASGAGASLFYLPALFTDFGLDAVFKPLFDDSSRDLSHLNIRGQAAFKIHVPQPMPHSANVEVQSMHSSWVADLIKIDVRIALTAERQVEHRLKLDFDPVILKVQKQTLTWVGSHSLSVGTGEAINASLVFRGNLQRGPKLATLIFNENSDPSDPIHPRVQVDGVDLPDNPRADRDLVLQTKQHPHLQILLSQFDDKDSFVDYCLKSKSNWYEAEQWLYTGQVSIWAKSISPNPADAERVAQIEGMDGLWHTRLWQTLLQFNPSLTLPWLHVRAGRKHQLEFPNLLPGIRREKEIVLWFEQPRIVMACEISSNMRWIQINESDHLSFTMHPEDGPLRCSISLNQTSLLSYVLTRFLNQTDRLTPAEEPQISVYIRTGFNDEKRLVDKIQLYYSVNLFETVLLLLVPGSVVLLASASALISWQIYGPFAAFVVAFCIAIVFSYLAYLFVPWLIATFEWRRENMQRN